MALLALLWRDCGSIVVNLLAFDLTFSSSIDHNTAFFKVVKSLHFRIFNIFKIRSHTIWSINLNPNSQHQNIICLLQSTFPRTEICGQSLFLLRHWQLMDFCEHLFKSFRFKFFVLCSAEL